MILGHGIDVASISRLRETVARQGTPFLERVFSENERAYCSEKQDPIPHYAARFAAKEAYGKAVQLGLGASGDMVDIEVLSDGKSAPTLLLHGRAKEIFNKRGGGKLFLSLSHDGDTAMASVIISGGA